MKAICVEDDPAVLAETKAMCEKFPGLTEVKGFLNAEDALGWLNWNRADAVLSDIRLPGMDGLAFAARIRQKYPETAVIFLTAHAEYAVEAFALHVSGYLLKPAETDPLYRELTYALQGHMGKSQSHISVTTFGNFDIRVDGKHISFPRSKAKELLAYLVDRQGSSITRPEAFALLWEEGFYDRAMQKQLDVIIRSLRQTLEKYGIGEIMELHSGTMRIRPELLDCDLYHFLEGDLDAVNAYRGEYMSSYSWASLTEAYMDRIGRGM